MSTNSNIEWTDTTWNPVVGCTKVSPGCDNCYAIRDGWRLGHNPNLRVRKIYEMLVRYLNGRLNWTGTVRAVRMRLNDPFGWRKPRRIFVNSQSDLFHEGVSTNYIVDVLNVCMRTPQHTYQILTKRSERMRDILRELAARDPEDRAITENIWLGVSVEDRLRKTRIDHLRSTPAAVRFLSCEPLLEDLGELDLRGISWVIIGGESGHGARPCDRRWIYNLIRQCKEANVPVFVKQLGTKSHIDNNEFFLPLKDRKGGLMEEWPEDLRVREFPSEIQRLQPQR
jgi:protein gp37